MAARNCFDHRMLKSSGEMQNTWKKKTMGEEDEPALRDPNEDPICAGGVEFDRIEEECNELFDSEVLKSCTAVLDPDVFKNACKADLCTSPGPETRGDLVKNYIKSCGDRIDIDDLECTCSSL